ncbi:MAG TPA: hypothetical protein VHB02_15220 [Acidimicrobiales bacterium]|nr:hypothetical protein [Acidimicrobiales bacterium]
MTGPRRRARRLLRWYPPAWRDRYGDEFTELLVADLEERPHAPGRTLDVVRGGAVARLAAAGLAGPVAAGQGRSGAATLGWAWGGFVVFAVAMWSQLAVDWQWSPPSAPVTRLAMEAMSAAMAVVAGLAVVAAGPVVWAVGRALARRGPEAVAVLRPVLVVAAAGTVLVLGSRHFGNGWPGTGGHPWADQGLVPGGVAAFCWAATLSVTSYWAHPGALGAFPAAELLWMVASPFATVVLLAAAARTVRRTPLSPRVVRHQATVGAAAAAAMAVFAVAGACWVVDGAAGPRGLFRTGAVDVVGLAAMAVAVAVVARVAARNRAWATG